MKEKHFIDFITSKTETFYHFITWLKAWKWGFIFKVICRYMHMVTEMLTFIRAFRTGDWKLHLQTLAKFSRYFFAHDMINYACMIPIYLAEMESLNESDPDIVQEFQQGNWVVNKNSDTSFCALGADQALEHINRSMKVYGRLIAITSNPSAHNKFFLIAPELAWLDCPGKWRQRNIII